MIRRHNRLTNARWARDKGWTELLTSTDRFLQAEMAFEWETDKVRKMYHLGPDEPLTVEAILARSRSEVFQNAVKDCTYHANRMQAFAALHSTAMLELGLLEEDPR